MLVHIAVMELQNKTKASLGPQWVIGIAVG